MLSGLGVLNMFKVFKLFNMFNMISLFNMFKLISMFELLNMLDMFNCLNILKHSHILNRPWKCCIHDIIRFGSEVSCWDSACQHVASVLWQLVQLAVAVSEVGPQPSRTTAKVATARTSQRRGSLREMFTLLKLFNFFKRFNMLEHV